MNSAGNMLHYADNLLTWNEHIQLSATCRHEALHNWVAQASVEQVIDAKSTAASCPQQMIVDSLRIQRIYLFP